MYLSLSAFLTTKQIEKGAIALNALCFKITRQRKIFALEIVFFFLKQTLLNKVFSGSSLELSPSLSLCLSQREREEESNSV